MSTIMRRLAPTIAAALTFAALVFPGSAVAAIRRPAPAPLGVAQAQSDLSSARASLGNAEQQVADLEWRIASLSLAISHAESLQPQSAANGVVRVLKAYGAPFSDTLMAETQATLDAAVSLETLRSKRAEVTATLDVAAAEAYARAESFKASLAVLQQAEQAEIARQAAVRAAAKVRREALVAKLGAFPVAGPNDYVDSWGFARSGGRWHKGADIMAARGTPVVAVKDGTVRVRSNRLGGLCVYLSADDGTEYYYPLWFARRAR